MRIIPAIDIIDGKCVRLTQGDYSKKKMYNENPLEVAKQYEDSGIKYLHVVDLDGAKSHRIVNYNVLESIASKTSLEIDFGGGLKSDKDLEIAFNSGAKQITGGSIAVNNQELFYSWIEKYGSGKIILGADVLDKKIAINGWKEITELDLFSFIKSYLERGIRSVICTDISKDGMLEGVAFDTYSELIKEFSNIKLIASGGVSTIKDLDQLTTLNMDGVIIGKAIYEGNISLRDLENFIINK